MQAWVLGVIGMITAALVGWGVIEPRESAMQPMPVSEIAIESDRAADAQRELPEILPGPYAAIVEAEWPATCTTRRCELQKRMVAGASTSVEFLEPFGPGEHPSYVIADDRVHVFMQPGYNGIQNVVMLPKADPATFAFIDARYAKDANRVFYIGSEGTRGQLPGADPATFRVEQPFGEGGNALGIDTDSVFFEAMLLDGIDPGTMMIEQGGDIIRDEDTVYLHSGTCEFRRYRQGELSEITAFTSPC